VTERFHQRVRNALDDPALQQALDRNAERRRSGWQAAFASLPQAEAVRRRAADIRRASIRDLDRNLDRFRSRLERDGVVVHEAGDAADACRIIAGLLEQRGVRRVVKSKSMVTEEIRLNPALEAAGIEVVETDLGEYIVQLRGEPPAHILTPAIHLRREDVARTFGRHLDMPFTTDVAAITGAARGALRRVFLEAEAGISGVNFGVAESGTLCLVTNEGNGRMVTTLPPLHIAVMGLERLVADLDELALMLEVLPRSATGQARTSYVSLLQGPRSAGDPDGPRQRHVVLVDNGRRRMLDSPLREALACIRCGACLNACPVYQEIGGHAYASVIPGPIGSVVSPGLWGGTAFGHLARASTLCGACRDACPVDIDLPGLLLRVRGEVEPRGPPEGWLSFGLRLYAWLIGRPGLYRLAQRVAGIAGRGPARRGRWMRRLPPPMHRWTRARDFPPFARRSFLDQWSGADFAPVAAARGAGRAQEAGSLGAEDLEGRQDGRSAFVEAASAVGSEVLRCTLDTVGDVLLGFLRHEGIEKLLCWDLEAGGWGRLGDGLRAGGIEIVVPHLPDEIGPERSRRLEEYARVQAGLTGAAAGLADAGTLVLPLGTGRPSVASLVPPVHLALLRAADLRASLALWLAEKGQRTLEQNQGLVLITGPSRTADIEMTLTLGVHGPMRLVILLVDG
jgi:L-lactate dehydrogenase complex protein LldF